MAIESVIFDFNGTLCRDMHLHDIAWDLFLEAHGIRLTDPEKEILIHGKNNRTILTAVGLGHYPEDKIRAFGLEKEAIYRKLLVEHQIPLVEGAIHFFEFLQANEIPFTLATSSGMENVSFYFEYYRLNRYFELGRVVYDDGTLPGKPAPDLFIRAAEILQIPPGKTLVFEDSTAGFEAARRFAAGKIIAVLAPGKEPPEKDIIAIHDFTQVDPGLFR